MTSILEGVGEQRSIFGSLRPSQIFFQKMMVLVLSAVFIPIAPASFTAQFL